MGTCPIFEILYQILGICLWSIFFQTLFTIQKWHISPLIFITNSNCWKNKIIGWVLFDSHKKFFYKNNIFNLEQFTNFIKKIIYCFNIILKLYIIFIIKFGIYSKKNIIFIENFFYDNQTILIQLFYFFQHWILFLNLDKKTFFIIIN